MDFSTAMHTVEKLLGAFSCQAFHYQHLLMCFHFHIKCPFFYVIICNLHVKGEMVLYNETMSLKLPPYCVIIHPVQKCVQVWCLQDLSQLSGTRTLIKKKVVTSTIRISPKKRSTLILTVSMRWRVISLLVTKELERYIAAWQLVAARMRREVNRIIILMQQPLILDLYFSHPFTIVSRPMITLMQKCSS